ncbi:MAG TPA: cysteine desulfurase NifS [Clostridiales bacterium]|nr:cysteine desulfurase NifS [Clostridiales bacterium]HBJ98467.1 cysteine desulfurase NifS [Clostridiales bacterium]
MKEIYLDHSATTRVDERVLQKMLPYFTEIYGNANSQHGYGREALKGVDWARDTIAELINCHPSEIYFTSGGTESDNWALKGIASSHKEKGKHIIISAIEHAAMIASCKDLEKQGFSVTLCPVHKDGIIDLEFLKNAIRDDTILISCMLANNEVGTIEPIKEIVKIAKEKGILVHTDAVQAMSSLKVDVKDLGVDLMSFSSHKFNGPKGVGALFIKTGVKIDRLITGGHQERTRRGGTTNVPGVIGMAEALRLARLTMDEDNAHIKALRDHFVERVEKEIPYVRYNGSRENRVVSNADFSFEYIEGESILFMLDLSGIAVSSGSACSSGSLDPSHVLLAIGVPIEIAHGSIRFSFGKENTMEETDYAVDKLKEIIAKLRAMSPLYSEKENKNV